MSAANIISLSDYPRVERPPDGLQSRGVVIRFRRRRLRRRARGIPFGVLELNREGLITYHNHGKGRPAVGLNFFDDIAACKDLRPVFNRVLAGDHSDSEVSAHGATFTFVQVLDCVCVVIWRERERSFE